MPKVPRSFSCPEAGNLQLTLVCKGYLINAFPFIAES